MEFHNLVRAAYEVPSRIPSRDWVVAFLADMVFQRSPFEFTSQYFFDFPLVFAIDLNR
jgi:hypothetical protein